MARFCCALLLCFSGGVRLYAAAGWVTAVTVHSNAVSLQCIGRPSLTKDLFERGDERYFVLSLNHSILLGPTRLLHVPVLQSAKVVATQYSLHPDVVHLVVQDPAKASFQVDTRHTKGNRYLITLALNAARSLKVFLDVGHGGFDPGGTGPDGLPESFVNLAVAKRLAHILRSEGIEVALDRTKDRYVSLPERVALADKSDSDLFLGLYCNASSDPAIHGTTTYYYHSRSYAFARYLEDRVARELDLSNDGVARDNLYVIRHTARRMPDVLIEYAYISNRHEEHLLASPEFRNHIAAAIAKAITGYFIRVEPSTIPEDAANGIAHITSVEATDGAVEIHSIGEPVVGSFALTDDQSRYFIVTLRNAILEGSARNFRVPPPFAAWVTVTQYTVNPDVVHLAIRESFQNTYRIDTQPSAGDGFVTTIYPTEN